MTTLLQLDASPRPGRAGVHRHGSQTRRLTDHFVSCWRARASDTRVIYRDVGVRPPAPVDARWIEAAFGREERYLPWMDAVLAESDALIDEVEAADVLVLGVPLYNFGMPAGFKAWIDNIVRIGRTFGFDPSRPEEPYVPLLRDRPRKAVLLSSRGGHGFDPGGAAAQMNHLDSHLRTVLGFIGIDELHVVAIEHEEDGGEALAASVGAALERVDALVERLGGPRMPTAAAA
ncbi:MAG: FMN-dependent NADH-azoreductase [Gammaproteobacteria bacterium]